MQHNFRSDFFAAYCLSLQLIMLAITMYYFGVMLFSQQHTGVIETAFSFSVLLILVMTSYDLNFGRHSLAEFRLGKVCAYANILKG